MPLYGSISLQRRDNFTWTDEMNNELLRIHKVSMNEYNGPNPPVYLLSGTRVGVLQLMLNRFRIRYKQLRLTAKDIKDQLLRVRVERKVSQIEMLFFFMHDQLKMAMDDRTLIWRVSLFSFIKLYTTHTRTDTPILMFSPSDTGDIAVISEIHGISYVDIKYSESSWLRTRIDIIAPVLPTFTGPTGPAGLPQKRTESNE